MFTKNISYIYNIHRLVNHLAPIDTKLVPLHQVGSQAYIKTTKHINTYKDTHGASRASPPGPLLGGGAPPTIGPSGPGGSRPVIAAPATATLRPWSATPTKLPHTSLGLPHPGSMTTCPRALPVALPPSGG
jgi:hypothetical protein